MSLSGLDKGLMAVAGAAGAGILTWQTQFPWLKYDIQMMQVQKKIPKPEKAVMSTFLIDKFEEHVASNPKKAMLIFEDSIYTYEFMDQQANRVANVMRQFGLKCNDTVAMMIHNEPAFMWTLLGLQKLGVTVAFINFHLRSMALSHSILAAEPKALFVGRGKDLLLAISDVLEDLKRLPVYVQGLPIGQVPVGMADFDAFMRKAQSMCPDRHLRSEMTASSTMTFIYTSGTTGLPKPVFISQRKAHERSKKMKVIDFNSADVLYVTVPLYHSVGGGLGIDGMLLTGCTMVLRKKFSASHFWSDCRRYDVTVILYIGELFRYILAQPKHKLDSAHNVRAAYGNGLRKDIFEEVLNRFKIPLLCEFFASTEAFTTLINVANRPGAVGRISPISNLFDSNTKALVKYDHASAMPIRNKHGRCIRAKPGETGLYLSKVPDTFVVNNDVRVYKASKEDNEKKLVRNAFKDGDIYFNYGDLLYLDNDYFVHFHDRIGDTFRWKGENVSTTEVASVMAAPSFIHDVNVYGVKIPGHDGRAGMAALILNEGEALNPDRLKELYTLCRNALPSYARPLFLRVLPEAVMTATFKHRKVELIQEGYDMTRVKNDLFFVDPDKGTYSPLSPQGLTSFLQSRL